MAGRKRRAGPGRGWAGLMRRRRRPIVLRPLPLLASPHLRQLISFRPILWREMTSARYGAWRPLTLGPSAGRMLGQRRWMLGSLWGDDESDGLDSRLAFQEGGEPGSGALRWKRELLQPQAARLPQRSRQLGRPIDQGDRDDFHAAGTRAGRSPTEQKGSFHTRHSRGEAVDAVQRRKEPALSLAAGRYLEPVRRAENLPLGRQVTNSSGASAELAAEGHGWEEPLDVEESVAPLARSVLRRVAWAGRESTAEPQGHSDRESARSVVGPQVVGMSPLGETARRSIELTRRPVTGQPWSRILVMPSSMLLLRPDDLPRQERYVVTRDEVFGVQVGYPQENSAVRLPVPDVSLERTVVDSDPEPRFSRASSWEAASRPPASRPEPEEVGAASEDEIPPELAHLPPLLAKLMIADARSRRKAAGGLPQAGARAESERRPDWPPPGFEPLVGYEAMLSGGKGASAGVERQAGVSSGAALRPDQTVPLPAQGAPSSPFRRRSTVTEMTARGRTFERGSSTAQLDRDGGAGLDTQEGRVPPHPTAEAASGSPSTTRQNTSLGRESEVSDPAAPLDGSRTVPDTPGAENGPAVEMSSASGVAASVSSPSEGASQFGMIAEDTGGPSEGLQTLPRSKIYRARGALSVSEPHGSAPAAQPVQRALASSSLVSRLADETASMLPPSARSILEDGLAPSPIQEMVPDSAWESTDAWSIAGDSPPASESDARDILPQARSTLGRERLAIAERESAPLRPAPDRPMLHLQRAVRPGPAEVHEQGASRVEPRPQPSAASSEELQTSLLPGNVARSSSGRSDLPGADADQPPVPSASDRGAGTAEQASDGGIEGGPDIDELAQKVYSALRLRLSVERERLGGMS